MKTAVIYSRVSTQEQSYQSQLDDLQKYSKLSNIKVVKVFGEKASGYDLSVERTEYDNMKEFVLNNDVKNILCWELSRFGRNTLHTLNEIEFFKQNGIDIFFKKENISTLSDEPTSKLLLTLLSSIAEMERNTIVSRSVRGRSSSAEKGKRVGFAIMPYGFSADDKGYITINEEEATVVRMIFDLYSKGIGSGEIANKLNSLGIPTRNKLRGMKRTLKGGNQIEILWRQNTLRKILKSTLYKGERTYREHTIVRIPQIVSEELWNSVQGNFQSHIGYVNATKYEYLFKSKVFCGECGLMYKTESRQYKTYLASYYSCYGRKDKGIKCKNGQIRSKFLDEKVYDLLFRHKDVMLKVYKDKAKTFKVEEKRSQIKFYEGLIEKEEAKKKRLVTLFKDGFIGENEFNSDQRKIKAEILKHQGSIDAINREIETFSDLNLAGTLSSLLTETDFNIKREFILKYVDKITVSKVNQTNIDFTKLSHTDMKTMIQKNLPSLRSDDKLMYIEIYAFGNISPLKLCLSSLSNIAYTSDKLTYILGHLSIDKK
jgi:DNA invertase Pin-like site-specific DNA recombinase